MRLASAIVCPLPFLSSWQSPFVSGSVHELLDGRAESDRRGATYYFGRSISTFPNI